MSKDTRPKGYRLAETRRGDTPQDVAERELGDAARWPEIVALNDLAPPWIVDSLADLEGVDDARVALAGQALKVPAPARRASAVADPDIHGTDMRLGADGRLGVDEETGDWALVSGPKNLAQALGVRLRTRLRELKRHPAYGNGVFRLLGRGGNRPRLQLAAAYTQRCIATDPRVSRSRDVRAEFVGDQLRCSGVAIATDGKPLPVAVGDEGE